MSSKKLDSAAAEVARLTELAVHYRAQGAYAQAAPLCERALRICETALGSEHPDMATSLNNLAALYQDQGAYAQAAPLCQCALRIRETALGPEHPEVARSLNNLAADEGDPFGGHETPAACTCGARAKADGPSWDRVRAEVTCQSERRR